MDYPDDPAVRKISSQFLVGDNMLVAPVMEGEKSRKVYLPEGDWYDFWTSKKFTGKTEYVFDVPLEQIPVFLKSGSILPLSKVTLHTDDPESWKLSLLVFGDDIRPTILYEEDGTSKPEFAEVRLSWDNYDRKVKTERKNNSKGTQYKVDGWKCI